MMGWLWKNFKSILIIARSPRFLAIFIACWAAVILFSGIRVGDLSGYDDAAYAHEAKAMLESGDWWTLSLNGNPDFDKPPLFIWLIALSFKLFGMSDFSAKIPGVMLGWGTILITFFLVKELFSQEGEEERSWLPVLSMLALATTQYFLKYSSHAMTDVPFTFFFTTAIYFYVLGLRNNTFLLLSGISIGLGLLMRSPMGIFPLAIIFCHLTMSKRYKLFLSPHLISSIIIALLLPATWYVAEYRLFGDFFINRHFNNVLAHSVETTNRTPGQQLLWYFEYLFKLGRLYLPWFPFMLFGLFLSFKKLKEGKSKEIQFLLLIWLFVVLIPFSVAESKVLRYILPVFPVMSIYTAYAILKILSVKNLPRFSQIIFILLLAAGVFIVWFPKYQERAADMKIIAQLTDPATKSDEKVVLYTFGELHWNYQTQLIWYGNRDCLLIKDLNDIEMILEKQKEMILVIDHSSTEQLSKTILMQTEKLGSSEKFTILRLKSPAITINP